MVSDSLVKEFQRLLGKDQVFLQEADRLTYAYDAAVLEPVLPALVVRPKST
jgi:glycolate oxidase